MAVMGTEVIKTGRVKKKKKPLDKWKLMLTEEEWGNFSKPLYMVRYKNKTAWRKGKNWGREWLHNSATESKQNQES